MQVVIIEQAGTFHMLPNPSFPLESFRTYLPYGNICHGLSTFTFLSEMSYFHLTDLPEDHCAAHL